MLGERIQVRFGTAGGGYPDWAGEGYPKPKPKGFDPLRYLAEYFQTIEINSTFYRPPTAQVARSWAKRVADHADFRFTAKLWKRFTHERTETWTKDEVAQAREGLDILHDSGKLGAVLLQFPWSFRNDEGNREWLRDLTTTFARYGLVVEVRHESWNEPGFYTELRERGLGFVNVDQPLFHHSIKPSARATSPIHASPPPPPPHRLRPRPRPQLQGLVPQGRGPRRSVRLLLLRKGARAL